MEPVAHGGVRQLVLLGQNEPEEVGVVHPRLCRRVAPCRMRLLYARAARARFPRRARDDALRHARRDAKVAVALQILRSGEQPQRT
eukprot:6201598-Pleurochrysis_carterae.AAC.8